MMQMRWIALIGLGLFALHTYAEEAVVIDVQTLGEQAVTPATNPNTATPVAAPLAPAESPEDANRARMLKSDKISPKQKAALIKAEAATSNKREGDAFLMANRAKRGVISLPSGVQYKILRASKGKKPNENSIVVCRYRGELIDGTTFDKSDSKKPLTLKVAGLLPGLKEAVKLMSTGSKWQIVVPPHLAYGEQGNQGVEPNAVLIYEMEIVSVK